MLLCRVTGRLEISIHNSISIYTAFILGHRKFSILFISMYKNTTRGYPPPKKSAYLFRFFLILLY